MSLAFCYVICDVISAAQFIEALFYKPEAHLIKKFSTFYRTQNFITVFTKAQTAFVI
jgi:hypothetical protein